MKLKTLIYSLILAISACSGQKNLENITLPANFYPEGITHDQKGNIYISSIKTGAIFKAKPGQNEAKPFITNDKKVNLVSAIGMIIDGDNLWACSSDPGVSIYKGRAPVSLKRINLKNKKITSYNLPNGGFCNDIAIDNSQNVYITDSFNPRILVLRNGSDTIETFVTSLIFQGKGFNLNGIAFDGLSNLFAAKYNDGKLFQIDIFSKKITTIDLPRRLFTPDGLKFHKDALIVVEGASYPTKSLARGGTGKITKIHLPYSNHMVSFETIKEGFDVPTTFTIIENDLWVVESQYDHLFKYGDKMLQPKEFNIYKIKLPQEPTLRKEWTGK